MDRGFCETCGDMVPCTTYVRRIRARESKGHYYECDELYAVCDICGAEAYIRGIDEANVRHGWAAWMKEKEREEKRIPYRKGRNF